MAYKTLLFGTDDLFETLKPLYVKEMERGTLDIVAAAVLENGGIRFVTDEIERVGINSIDIDLAIISSKNNFYERMKQLENMGLPRNRIIDGNIFKVQNLDFPRLLNEGVAYGIFENSNSFTDTTSTVYPLFYRFKNNKSVISFDTKSYISINAKIEGHGILSIGKYVSIAWNNNFEFGLNNLHDYKKVSSFDLGWFNWQVPSEFFSPKEQCKILIGNDVWIGRGCVLKSVNPEKPLIIGDGSIVASDSVVVKNVPPYAIVGGNPAQIIKYRFPPHVIEALLRIKWWDWSFDKIHDNFKYFNDIEKFISLHDK